MDAKEIAFRPWKKGLAIIPVVQLAARIHQFFNNGAGAFCRLRPAKPW